MPRCASRRSSCQRAAALHTRLWVFAAAGLQPADGAGAASRRAYAQARGQSAEFERNGLVVLKSVFGKEEVERCRRYVDTVLWSPDRRKRPPLVVEVTSLGKYLGTGNAGVGSSRYWLKEAPRAIRNLTYRMVGTQLLPAPNPLWSLTDDITILGIARELIGGHISTISGLLFERGTQQSLHDDTWYGLAGQRLGAMIGVWFALEDVDDDNGPLLYVPGSHRERPEWNFTDGFPGRGERPRRLQITSAEARDFAYQEARPYESRTRALHIRAGDVAIWHERLLHGGAPIKDQARTRLSMVFHYRNMEPGRKRHPGGRALAPVRLDAI